MTNGFAFKENQILRYSFPFSLRVAKLQHLEYYRNDDFLATTLIGVIAVTEVGMVGIQSDDESFPLIREQFFIKAVNYCSSGTKGLGKNQETPNR